MDWLRRIGHTHAPAAAEPPPALPAGVERATPGIVALFDGVSEDRSHAVLDLGPATDSSLGVYSRFARRIRFADLLGAATWGGWAAALKALPPQPERPYDLVFAWDILDRLAAEERARLMERLAELTAPNARLHLVVASEVATTHPLRFTLLDVDRIRYEPMGAAWAARPQLLPAEVERMLAPFQVVRAFTSRVGMREYVAARVGV